MAAHLLEDVETIDDGHVALDEDDVGGLREAGADRLHAVGGGGDREPRVIERGGEALEQARGGIADDDPDLVLRLGLRVGFEEAVDGLGEHLVGRAHGIAEHHADAGEPAQGARLDLGEAVRDLAGGEEALAVWRDHDLHHRAGG